MHKNSIENGRHLMRFRAWDRDDSTLYEWDCFNKYPLNGKNGTFPQEYTGFCDKNENKIYLGDIVSFREYNTVVKFLDGSYILEILEPKSTMKFFWFHTVRDNKDEMEIIGNTYSHPEYIRYHLMGQRGEKQ
jgi:Mg2+ and Co2+ transporter CorA